MPLQALYHSGYRTFRRKPKKYVNMIFRNLHLFYLKLIAYGDLFHAFGNKIPEFSSHYPFAVFGNHTMWYLVSYTAWVARLIGMPMDKAILPAIERITFHSRYN